MPNSAQTNVVCGSPRASGRALVAAPVVMSNVLCAPLPYKKAKLVELMGLAWEHLRNVNDYYRGIRGLRRQTIDILDGILNSASPVRAWGSVTPNPHQTKLSELDHALRAHLHSELREMVDSPNAGLLLYLDLDRFRHRQERATFPLVASEFNHHYRALMLQRDLREDVVPSTLLLYLFHQRSACEIGRRLSRVYWVEEAQFTKRFIGLLQEQLDLLWPKERRKAKDRKGKNISATMMAAVAANPETLERSAREWATALQCSHSTVVGSNAWQHLKTVKTYKANEEAALMNRDKLIRNDRHGHKNPAAEDD